MKVKKTYEVSENLWWIKNLGKKIMNGGKERLRKPMRVKKTYEGKKTSRSEENLWSLRNPVMVKKTS